MSVTRVSIKKISRQNKLENIVKNTKEEPKGQVKTKYYNSMLGFYKTNQGQTYLENQNFQVNVNLQNFILLEPKAKIKYCKS